jgi:hypothetical protein
MKWETAYGNIDATKVRAIAVELQLSGPKAELLAIRLHKARSAFDTKKRWETIPRGSAVARYLGDLEKSIKRIAHEARNPTRKFVRAKSRMSDECELWAATQQPDKLHELGFDPTNEEHGTYFGSFVIVERWFNQSLVILQSLQRAKKFLAQPERRGPEDALRGVDRSNKAKRHLCGVALPKLYTELTGKTCKPQKDNADRLRNVGGVKFVVDCHDAMKLGKISPETVKSHLGPQRNRL